MVSFENTAGPFIKSIQSNGILFGEKMKYEAHRLGSFATWNHDDKARPVILAKYGFYSTDDKSDSVTCYSCGVQKVQWNLQSDPESEHKRLNPECLHILGLDQNNVPIYVPDEDIANEILRQLHAMYCSDVPSTADLSSPVDPIEVVTSRPSTNNNVADSRRPVQPSGNVTDSTSSGYINNSHFKTHLIEREAKLRSEEERLKTFQDGWPHANPTPAELAQDGFIFTEVADRVQCVFCNGILRNWEPTDNAATEHRKHFPGCGFVKNRNVGNIPRRLDVRSDLGITLPTSPLDNRIEVLRFEDGVFTEPPRHPQYATESSRIATFTHWPGEISQTPAMLAKAGFYYAGFDDSVKCFHCDGGLRTWEPNDDPWEEHAKWFSRCPYVLQCKGEAFVQRVKNGSGGANSQTEEREITARLDLPVVQKVLHMDIPRDRVKKVLQDRLNRTGDDFESVEDLLNAIYHLGDTSQLKRKQQNMPSRTAILPSPVSKVAVSVGERESAVLDDNTTSFDDTESSAEHESLLLENQRLKDQRTCKICMDEEANIVLLPCGHLVSCATCSPALRKCPICRSNIKGTVRTFLS